MEYKDIKIKTKILVPLFIVIGLVVAASIEEVFRMENKHLRERIENETSHMRLLLDGACAEEANLMGGLIGFIDRNKKLRSAWRRRDRDALLDEATPIFLRLRKRFKITHFYFTDADRTCFLRVHNPPRNGDVINRNTTLRAERDRKDSYGLELGKFGMFTLRYVHPWIIDGKLAGYLELGKELSEITRRLTKTHSSELIFTIRKKFLNQKEWEEGQEMLGLERVWSTLNDSVISCDTFKALPSPLREILNSTKPENQRKFSKFSFDDKDFRMETTPLFDCAGRKVGTINVLIDVTKTTNGMRAIGYSIVLAGVIGVALLYLFFYFYLGAIEGKLNKEEKAREEALRTAEESEARLKLISDSLQAGVVTIDYDTHEILEVNPYAARLIGLEPEKIVGRVCHEFICPAERGNCPARDGNTTCEQSERTLLTADGCEIPIMKSVVPLDMMGRQVLVENFIDISDMKEVEARLRMALDNWRRTFDAMDEMISIISKDFKILDANKAMKDIFGEELTGLACHELVHALPHPPDVCPVRKMMRTGEPVRTEFFESNLDLWLDVGVFPVKNDSGEIIEFIHSVRNITERKKAEKKLNDAIEAAKEAAKAKSEFLAAMSHEIRTPMNGVIGMSDLLLGTELTEEQEDYVETIRISGENLLCIINDILDFSKIESGKLELEKRDFALAECVEGVLEILAETARKKDIELNYLLNDGVPEFINGDSTRLRQILINLANNALKFTERGEVLISVEKTREDEKTIELSFSVKDTGIGIPKEKLDVLFNAFTQADSSTTRKYGGTGLGLAISKRLSELMEGGISVESEVGKGSTFTFTVKVGKVANPPKKPNLDSLNTLKDLRVLIVDDTETNRKILTILCGRWGMIPVAVPGGAEALRELEEEKKFHLVLLDMHMPEMDGLTLAEKIREKFTSEELPMIMLSSHGTLSEIVSIKKHVNEYLSKPIKQSLLLETILQCFEGNDAVKRELAETAVDHSLNDALGKRNPLSILLAEDNKINQKVMLKALNKMGYSADLAENGTEAVDAVRRKRYDIVFMDVHMPEMDGLEATKRIVAEIDAESRPLIIAMTANAMDGDREKCMAAGMDDYVSKPINLKEIQNKLERWSSMRRG